MPLLANLNKIREEHVALQQDKSIHFHDIDNPELLCYSKRDKDDVILVVVNLDAINVQSGWTNLDLSAFGFTEDIDFECQDLLQNHSYQWSGRRNFVRLDPSIFPAHIFHVCRVRSIEGIQ
jgi:starch synthase (maltosyl-transferring)